MFAPVGDPALLEGVLRALVRWTSHVRRLQLAPLRHGSVRRGAASAGVGDKAAFARLPLTAGAGHTAAFARRPATHCWCATRQPSHGCVHSLLVRYMAAFARLPVAAGAPYRGLGRLLVIPGAFVCIKSNAENLAVAGRFGRAGS